jgi:hypothetical protein
MIDPIRRNRGTAVRTKLFRVSQTIKPTPVIEKGEIKRSPRIPTIPRAIAIQTPDKSKPNSKTTIIRLDNSQLMKVYSFPEIVEGLEEKRDKTEVIKSITS